MNRSRGRRRKHFINRFCRTHRIMRQRAFFIILLFHVCHCGLYTRTFLRLRSQFAQAELLRGAGRDAAGLSSVMPEFTSVSHNFASFDC